MPSSLGNRIRSSFVKSERPSTAPFAQQRHDWEQGAALTPLAAGVSVSTLVADGVPCTIVSAAGSDEKRLVVYLHGGGFTAGSAITHRGLATQLSAAAGVPVLLIDYGLAPEHPFPDGRDDTVRVYRWLLSHGHIPAQMVFGGDSAGAAVAAAALLELRDRGEPLPRAAFFISPWFDLALAGDTIRTRANMDPLTSPVVLAEAARHYLLTRDPRDPLVSPLYAELRGFPATLLHAGDHEILLSDSIRFAARARATNVDVDLEVWPEMWHVWHAWAPELPEANDALAKLGAFVRRQTSSARLADEQDTSSSPRG